MPNWPTTPPQGFDDQGFRFNPGQSIPFPLGKDLPVASWECQNIRLIWAPGPGPINPEASWHATWGTPLFDLRPEIGQAAPDPAINAQTIRRGGYGAGGQLFVSLLGIQSANDACTGLVVSAQEFGHPFGPTATQLVMSDYDATMYFIDTSRTVVVPFMPPGSGYPIRYWRLRLTFEVLAAKAFPPDFTISAAYY